MAAKEIRAFPKNSQPVLGRAGVSRGVAAAAIQSGTLASGLWPLDSGPDDDDDDEAAVVVVVVVVRRMVVWRVVVDGIHGVSTAWMAWWLSGSPAVVCLLQYLLVFFCFIFRLRLVLLLVARLRPERQLNRQPSSSSLHSHRRRHRQRWRWRWRLPFSFNVRCQLRFIGPDCQPLARDPAGWLKVSCCQLSTNNHKDNGES